MSRYIPRNEVLKNNKYLRLLVLLLTLVVIAQLGLSVYMLAPAWEQAQVDHEAESRCIAYHIGNGVERKDIVAKDGMCHVLTSWE